ncbi:MAG TPA: hypothetical protein VMI35_00045, partial [Puia sp.]|nr:hypothetical protein [Puia sp.]
MSSEVWKDGINTIHLKLLQNSCELRLSRFVILAIFINLASPKNKLQPRQLQNSNQHMMRLDQVVGGIIKSLIFMVKYPPLIIAVCILLSCSNNNQAVNLQEGIKSDTSAKATAILFSYPEIIDSSHIVIYPLILERTSYGSGISSSYGGERTTYWNLIFYNTDDKTQKLLTKDKRIIITSMKSNDKSSTSSDYRWSEGIDIYENHIFYEVVSKDFNQNNYLDINDPTYLYVSDKKGN